MDENSMSAEARQLTNRMTGGPSLDRSSKRELSPSKRTLLEARMQGDSQDGFSSMGFVVGDAGATSGTSSSSSKRGPLSDVGFDAMKPSHPAAHVGGVTISTSQARPMFSHVLNPSDDWSASLPEGSLGPISSSSSSSSSYSANTTTTATASSTSSSSSSSLSSPLLAAASSAVDTATGTSVYIPLSQSPTKLAPLPGKRKVTESVAPGTSSSSSSSSSLSSSSSSSPRIVSANAASIPSSSPQQQQASTISQTTPPSLTQPSSSPTKRSRSDQSLVVVDSSSSSSSSSSTSTTTSTTMSTTTNTGSNNSNTGAANVPSGSSSSALKRKTSTPKRFAVESLPVPGMTSSSSSTVAAPSSSSSSSSSSSTNAQSADMVAPTPVVSPAISDDVSPSDSLPSSPRNNQAGNEDAMTNNDTSSSSSSSSSASSSSSLSSSSSTDIDSATGSPQRKRNTIASYFPRTGNPPSQSTTTNPRPRPTPSPPSSSFSSSSSSSSDSSSSSSSSSSSTAGAATPPNPHELTAAVQAARPIILAELARLKEALQEKFSAKERELEEKVAKLAEKEKQLETSSKLAEERAQELSSSMEEYRGKTVSVLVDTLRSLAAKTRRELDHALHSKRKSIGRVVIVNDMMSGPTEMWEDGETLKEVQNKIKALTEEKTEVENKRKSANRVKRGSASKDKDKEKEKKDDKSGAAGAGGAGGAKGLYDDVDVEIQNLFDLEDTTSLSSSSSMLSSATGSIDRDTDGFMKPKARGPLGTISSSSGAGGLDPAAVEMDEVYKLRLSIIKRDLQVLQTQLEELELQKKQLIKSEKLFLDEGASRMSNYPIVNKRYLFLDMLGKGGFSEVFRAFDLVELKYVACKIHQLNPTWSDERRASYLKHVIRESTIQKELSHPRVVRLNDVFKLDSATLITVLDLCEGGDLDMYLKVHETLPEREARCIIMQVFSALKHLNEQKQRVIHYDLKPANILFHKGEVKLTDFGLSKQVEEAQTSTELTSQGAGTLWYLPPECFITAHKPLITSAVDVWSCGVILYQMLFGKRPFGAGQANIDLMMAQGAGKAKLTLEFPSKPQVSDLAKDFVRKCLSVNPAERPDVLNFFEEPFFKNYK